jgi:hypothetical protein
MYTVHLTLRSLNPEVIQLTQINMICDGPPSIRSGFLYVVERHPYPSHDLQDERLKILGKTILIHLDIIEHMKITSS